jgi:hypothetical protein
MMTGKYDLRAGDTEGEMLSAAAKSTLNRVVTSLPRLFSQSTYNSELEGQPISMSSIFDIVVHVALWVFAYVMEIIIFVDADKMAHNPAPNGTANPVALPYAAASLSLMTVSLAALFLVLLYHACFAAIRGNLDAYLITFITAGVKVSFLFVVLIATFATSFAEATDEWRVRTILSMISKAYLITHLSANMRPCNS